MKKRLHYLPVLFSCLFGLTSCGKTDVNFSNFKEKGNEALREMVDYTSCKATGTFINTIIDSNKEIEVNCSFYLTRDRVFTAIDSDNATYASILQFACSLKYYVQEEITDAKYYIEDELKVTYEVVDKKENKDEFELRWNSVALPTYFKGAYKTKDMGGIYNLSISYNK